MGDPSLINNDRYLTESLKLIGIARSMVKPIAEVLQRALSLFFYNDQEIRTIIEIW